MNLKLKKMKEGILKEFVQGWKWNKEKLMKDKSSSNQKLQLILLRKKI